MIDLKYDIDRSLGEILKRGENLSRKKHRRSACIFGTLSGITAAIIAVVFFVLGICISLGAMRLSKRKRPAFAMHENGKGGKSI